MMADQIYKDSIRTPEERAKSLLEEMSLDEKMAQAAGVFPFGEDYQDMEKLAAQMPFRNRYGKYPGDAEDPHP